MFLRIFPFKRFISNFIFSVSSVFEAPRLIVFAFSTAPTAEFQDKQQKKPNPPIEPDANLKVIFVALAAETRSCSSVCFQHVDSCLWFGTLWREVKTSHAESEGPKRWRSSSDSTQIRSPQETGDTQSSCLLLSVWIQKKKTIRGLLGSWGPARSGPALSHGHSSKQSGALSHLITQKPEAPFLCCLCHACPIPFSCESLSTLEVC